MYQVKESSAQTPIQCGLLNESCCNLAGSEPDSCKSGVGLKCESGICVPDGTNANPPDRTSVANSASSDTAFPQWHLNCTDTRPTEFQSLRPYQAAPCGDAPKAEFCSNKLKFIEDIDITNVCENQRQGKTGTFICDNIEVHVQKHNLFVSLDQSQFPIMGNTEDVINHANSTDTIDDATKLNEYVSWYLNGVVDKAEYKDSTDDKIVNFSGPVRKLLPSVIQDVNRIKTIESASTISSYTDEDTGKEVRDAENHDQIVVDNLRLSSWGEGNLSPINTFFNNWLGTDVWDHKYPPLPWQFKSQILFQKAYQEWQGKNCAILPILGLQCADTPVSNEWAEKWRFVPLANTSDKKGANFLVTKDGPSYDAAEGTTIKDDQHITYTNAPLYFAHTQEVMDLANELNKTYTPGGYESEKVPQTTEVNDCSALTVRENKGDNLFPGDKVEISVTGAEYTITSGKCVETIGRTVGDYDKDGKLIKKEVPGKFKCNAEVGIILQLATKTPFANEIFANTVADSGSTFRKIFPKVEEGAPVSCIADIPTVTSVIYDPEGSQLPKTVYGTGTQEFKVERYPDNGSGDIPELTFPHIGSVYEYFLKGIQTALRPKGYGEPIVDGVLCSNLKCGELPRLPVATGSCNLGSVSSRVGDLPQSLKDIISAAAETYKVPPNLVVGALFGEGVFNKGSGSGVDDGAKFTKYPWSDYNVKNWATCTALPNCSGPETSLILFYPNIWDEISKAIEPDLKKLDPNKTTADPCNLLDSIYAVTWDLKRNGFGTKAFEGEYCFGIPLNSGISTNMDGCSWDDRDIETAIRWWEFGTDYNSTYTCATLENSCATGGGVAANCPTGDNCETVDTRYSSPSHNACVFDVAHGR